MTPTAASNATVDPGTRRLPGLNQIVSKMVMRPLKQLRAIIWIRRRRFVETPDLVERAERETGAVVWEQSIDEIGKQDRCRIGRVRRSA
jgi:hypothetical protein